MFRNQIVRSLDHKSSKIPVIVLVLIINILAKIYYPMNYEEFNFNNDGLMMMMMMMIIKY